MLTFVENILCLQQCQIVVGLDAELEPLEGALQRLDIFVGALPGVEVHVEDFVVENEATTTLRVFHIVANIISATGQLTNILGLRIAKTMIKPND